MVAHVTVVVPTRGRPVGCVRLVRQLLRQSMPDTWLLRVVVVDNNDEPGGLPLGRDPRVRVVQEAVPGIPDARNRGVHEALSEPTDVIVFIDDDEVPASEQWLAELVRPVVHGQADVTTGPVRSVFGPGVPDWVRRQEVFRRREHPEGADPGIAYTHNCAVSAMVFAQMDRWFDLSFRSTGGSDTEFFRRVHAAGHRFQWVSSAVVEESVPPTRATPRWVLARSYRIGANRVQFLRADRSRPGRWILLLTGSLGEVLLFIPAVVVGAFSRRLGLGLAGRAVRGLGFLAALNGRTVRAYE